MTDHWKTAVLAVMLVVSVCCVCAGLACRDITDVGECVVVRPLEAVSGHIAYPGLHRVLYRGTTKVTDEACTTEVWITEFEYERLMYGRKD